MAQENSDQDLIHSDLETSHSQGSYSVSIQIYRSTDTDWTLEVVAADGNSTVWEDPFDSEDAALGEAILAIRDEGIQSFYANAPEPLLN